MTRTTYAVTVLADSVALPTKVRLATLLVTFPRYVLAEFNTHRVFSRCSASSRAVPVEKRIQQVRENPFVPEFSKNKKGMQADEVLSDVNAAQAETAWVKASLDACKRADELVKLEVHKQQANRLLEPFLWQTVIVSATEWDNFFALRAHKDASPEMYRIATLMRDALSASRPKPRNVGDWHLPLIFKEDLEGDELLMHDYDVDLTVDPTCLLCDASYEPTTDRRACPVKLAWISTSRCAAVSYERHLNRDTAKDLDRFHRLRIAGHMSPLEHAAVVIGGPGFRRLPFIAQNPYFNDPDTGRQDLPHSYDFSEGVVGAFPAWDRMTRTFGNFSPPWMQLRKMFADEDVFRPKEAGR